MSIGVFDSGVGGLTVFNSLSRNFPDSDIYYLGDTARVPYGNKSRDTVKRYSKECADFLISNFSVDVIVIACNTASSYAVDFLEQLFGIPVIGVVEPGAKEAVKITKNRKIGVIGTRGTIKSGSYAKAIKNRMQETEVFLKACPLFVPLVEEGRTDDTVTEIIIKEYLEELYNHDIDTIILGCTHYPLIKETIKKIFPGFNIVDSSEAIISLIREMTILKTEKGKRQIFITDESETFSNLANQIIGCSKIEHVSIE